MIEKHPRPREGTEEDVLLKRVGAHIVDNLLMAFVLIAGVLGLVVGYAALQSVSQLFATIVAILVSLALLGFWVYYAFLMEGHLGRTLGKAMFGLVVVKEDGSACTTGASVVRNVCWLIDGFGIGPLMIGLICFITDRNQRVGDMAAGTVVVEAEPEWVADRPVDADRTEDAPTAAAR